MKIPKRQGAFILDGQKPTTMKYGFYYKAEFAVPFSDEKRTIRVWLPENYDFSDGEKRFPVVYFADGQNLVNRYLTAFGDWGLDKVCHSLLTENGLSFIAVGVDSPSDDLKRACELCPPIRPDRAKDIVKPVGDLFVNFIADTLKPVIDETFNTLPEKPSTAIGGSSMGGIAAFYGGATRNDVFGCALDFSPAFLLYSRKAWKDILDGLSLSIEKGVRHFLYVGGKGFEKKFVSATFFTYKYMMKKGFSHGDVTLIFHSEMIHHEKAWNKYLPDAISFWLGDGEGREKNEG